MILNRKILSQFGWTKSNEGVYSNKNHPSFNISIANNRRKINSKWVGNFILRLSSFNINVFLYVIVKDTEELSQATMMLDQLVDIDVRKDSINYESLVKMMIEGDFSYYPREDSQQASVFEKGLIIIRYYENTKIITIRYNNIIIMHLSLLIITKSIIYLLLGYLSWYESHRIYK